MFGSKSMSSVKTSKNEKKVFLASITNWTSNVFVRGKYANNMKSIGFR